MDAANLLHLEDDLLEALDGVDPEEFLLVQDPDLAAIARKVQAEKIVECLVCGDPTKGVRYYGVMVCTSCRAFFSRAVKGDAHLDFACLGGGGGDCQVDSKSWTSCKKCRYQKCLSAGMTIAKSRPSPPRTYGNSSAQTARDKFPGPATIPTLEERLEVEAVVSKCMNFGYASVVQFYRRNPHHFKGTLDLIYHGRPNSLTFTKTLHDYLVFSATRDKFRHLSEYFSALPPRDRSRLAVGNAGILNEFVTAYTWYNLQSASQEAWQARTRMFLDQVLTPEDGGGEDLRRIHDEVSDGNTLLPKLLSHEQYYNFDDLIDHVGGRREREAAERHKKAANKIASLSANRDFDPVQYMLTYLIILFTPDFLDDLQDPVAAAKIQSAFAYMLHRHLRASAGDDEAASAVVRGAGLSREEVFRETMLASSYARELRDIRNRAFRRLNIRA